MGLDSDRPGVGRLIAEAAGRYGVDNMNVLFLTPLPGTRLWKQFEAEGRIAMDAFPEDWKYYTLNYPVARYKYLSRDQIIREMNECNSTFYSAANILDRLGRNLLAGRNPLLGLVSNLTSRRNSTAVRPRLRRRCGKTGAGSDKLGPLEEHPPLDALGMWETGMQLLRGFAAALKMQVAWLFRQS